MNTYTNTNIYIYMYSYTCKYISCIRTNIIVCDTNSIFICIHV